MLKVLDAVIWRLDTRRDFIPIGSEQPTGGPLGVSVLISVSIGDGGVAAVGRTVELAAHQLHAQRAGPAADQREEPEVLGDDGRVEQVSLGSVVVHVPRKHLRAGQQSSYGAAGRGDQGTREKPTLCSRGRCARPRPGTQCRSDRPGWTPP